MRLRTMGPWKWIPCTTDVFKILHSHALQNWNISLSQFTFYLDFVGFRWDAVWVSQPQQAAYMILIYIVLLIVLTFFVVRFSSSTTRVEFTQIHPNWHYADYAAQQKPIPKESASIPLFLLLFRRGLESTRWLYRFDFTFPGACASKADLSWCTNHFGAPCAWWMRPWVPSLKPEHPMICSESVCTMFGTILHSVISIT